MRVEEVRGEEVRGEEVRGEGVRSEEVRGEEGGHLHKDVSVDRQVPRGDHRQLYPLLSTTSEIHV